MLPNCIGFEIGYGFFSLLVFFGQFMMELCIPIDISKYTSLRIIVNRLTHKPRSYIHIGMHTNCCERACMCMYLRRRSSSTSDFVYGQSKPFEALCVVVSRLYFALSLSSPHQYMKTFCAKPIFTFYGHKLWWCLSFHLFPSLCVYLCLCMHVVCVQVWVRCVSMCAQVGFSSLFVSVLFELYICKELSSNAIQNTVFKWRNSDCLCWLNFAMNLCTNLCLFTVQCHFKNEWKRGENKKQHILVDWFIYLLESISIPFR